MFERLREGIFANLSQHLGLYFFVLLLLAIGVVFGAVAVKTLDEAQKLELIEDLHFFQETVDPTTGSYDGNLVMRLAVANNLKAVGLTWLLGLTVIGIPVVAMIVFIRGFVIGFTVGFMVYELGYRGILLALLVVLPHNLLAVPAIVAAGTAALSFSFFLVRSRISGEKVLYEHFISYTVLVGLTALILVGASFIEAYVTPVFIYVLKTYLG